MGNFFKKVPYDKFDESLVQFLKSRKISHLNEAAGNINDSYPTSSTLNLDEYYDVFANFLEDRTEQVFLLLQNDKNLDGKVDVYESLAVIIVFCGEELGVKLQFIFQMFDFDRSGEIELKELVMTFQTSIRALCKMVFIEVPSADVYKYNNIKELEFYANKLFLKVDTDRSRSLSFVEFADYMSHSWELQDFLLMYALIQTYQNADRRTKEAYLLYAKFFEIIAGGEQVQELDSASLKLVIQKELTYLDQSVIDMLLRTLEDTSKDYCKFQGKEISKDIVKTPYLEVMSAWAAFDATDINHDNQLCIGEVRFLLYAYEGDIPDEFRIIEEMEQLDKDGSGFVSREEWINYLCLNTETQGKCVFRGNLKRLFNKYDTDNSGALSMSEIRLLIKDNLKEHAIKFKHKSLEDQADFQGMIESLGDQIMEELNKDNDQNVSWVEFKHFMEQSYKKLDILKDFLKQF